MRKRLLTLLILCLLGWSAALAESLLPFDNTDQAPHFLPFREELERAVANRDAAFIRQRTQDAKLRFGTATQLEQKFDLSDPNSPFWAMMEQMLAMGGAWQAGDAMVVYPYAYASFPKRLSLFDHDVVIARDVPLHNSADPKSFEVGSVSYEVVWVLERQQGWCRVRSDSGVTGWVETQYLYSPSDFRMGLSLVDGHWGIDYIISEN